MQNLFVSLLAFAGLAGSAIAQDEPVIEHPVWQHLPSEKTMQKFAPVNTGEQEYEGQIDLICRIRTAGGGVTCQIVGMDPRTGGDHLDLDWAQAVRRAIETDAALNMKATPGARVGALIHVRWKIVLA